MTDAPLASRAARGREWVYKPAQNGHWDELLDTSGRFRPHWQRLAAGLRRMGYVEFERREEAGQRLIQSNGITYNVYGDPQGKERPWLMDLVPLVIDAAEWARVERAVAQRAALLNAVLGDLYGPQRLLSEGALPPELVFANPSFLRPARGVVPRDGVFLQNYAVDIARAPTGDWWVIADRAQAPSGLGYALENRLVSARTLPTVIDQCRVRSLTRFFDNTFEALLRLAPEGVSEPRVVVLTSGPHNETYFEHSFLSKHWGVPLVGGDDLTVRENRVYLKTLAGLNPVDVIVRRMDDDFCDPLELRGDSLLGVPGLMQAARAGTVFIANSLGSGLVETPSLMAFLPSLCRHLLGETLQLPSVATWWCGQERPRRRVLDDLERLVIKPTFPRFGQHAEFPARMSADERRALAERIEANPAQYVAQEQVDLSTTPVHTHRGIEPRHVVLRVPAAWDGSSYAVLPGGLARVSTSGKSLIVSMQLGGGSKDTWVIGGDPETSDGRRHAPRPAPHDGTLTELSSRVADNLFWLGRYAERLEATARIIRVLLPGLSGEAAQGRGAAVDTTLHFLDGLRLLPREFQDSPIARQWWRLQGLLGQMVFDADHDSGIGWNVRQIRRLSWEVKERLSQDTWRVLQQLERGFASAPPMNPDRRFVVAANQLDDVVIMLSAFAGLLSENPTRGHGWRFLDIGRRVERALQMIELLRVGVATAPFPDDACLDVLVQVADSSTTYRSRYLTSIRTRFVLELLLTDEGYPRSVAYQLAALVERLDGLPLPDLEGSPVAERVLAARLRALVRDARIDELKRRDTRGKRLSLEAYLQTLRNGVLDLSEAMSARYLSHSMPSRLTPSA
ncbi:MAG TPA: circularly permuted type 2 ATP-grasp protein [Vicinamibacterales bacterium]|nr:circularly permuted type 2 ATP-grasp protein [Vicinamibacterales bacterium]